MTKTKGIDYYPKLEKTEIPRKIFTILGLKWDENDTSEDSESGGGGTCTKQAWGKILKKLEELQDKGIDLSE